MMMMMIILMKKNETKNEKNETNEDKKWALLKQRIVQHDIRVLSKSFSQMTFTQASSLLCVDITKLEIEMAKLATQLGFDLDRRFELINFCKKKEIVGGIDILSKWADDLTELFTLVDNTEQFIQKVRTVHQVK